MFDILQDEDRPPIEVGAGSITFVHGFRWMDHGSGTRKRWKPDHRRGHSVGHYEVRVTEGDHCSEHTGKEVTIEYTEDATRYPFRVSRVEIGHSGKFEPLVISEQPMERDCFERAISFGRKGSGRITRVAVDGQDVPLTGASVGVEIQPRRAPLTMREAQSVLAMILSRLARLFEDGGKRPRGIRASDEGGRSRAKKAARRRRK